MMLLIFILIAAAARPIIPVVVGEVQLPKFITNKKDLTTRVTGFASSKQTSLFGIPHDVLSSNGNNSPILSALTGAGASTSSSINDESAAISNDDDDGDGAISSSSLLWAHYSPSEGRLYLQSNETTVQVIANKERNWECKTLNEEEINEIVATKTTPSSIDANAATSSNPMNWIPLEGLFGMYRIPSGTIWVLITGSEVVYDMDLNLNNNNNPPSSTSKTSLFQIRRVTSLELVHIPYQQQQQHNTNNNINNNNNPQQLLKEEIRQVQLLRKALKQHSFYYMANSSTENNNGIVPDMTKHLQKAFLDLHHNNKNNKNNNNNNNIIISNDGDQVKEELVAAAAAAAEQEGEEEEQEEIIVEINATTTAIQDAEENTAAAATAAATNEVEAEEVVEVVEINATTATAIHNVENTTAAATTTNEGEAEEEVAVVDINATTASHESENITTTTTTNDISSSIENTTATVASPPAEVNTTTTTTSSSSTTTPIPSADTKEEEEAYYSLSGFPSTRRMNDKQQKWFWEDWWFGLGSSNNEEEDGQKAKNVTDDAKEKEEEQPIIDATNREADADNNDDSCSTSKTMYWWEDLSSSNNNYAAKPDSRFFWNEAAVEPLIKRYHEDKDNDDGGDADCNKLLLKNMIPLTSAFVGVQRKIAVKEDSAEAGGKAKKGNNRISYDQLLISRRSRFRAGTRFTKRGADATGAVANYAETEQICLVYKGDKPKRLYSHIQTRGSIPLRWSSPTDIKTYRPRVRIGMDPMAQTRALLAHVLEQLQLYTTTTTTRTNGGTSSSNASQLVFVNLIDKKSDQGRLGRAFDAVLNAVLEVYAPVAASNSSVVPNQQQVITLEPQCVEHVWWDFHANCRNGRWDRLSKLLKKTKPSLSEHGYFCVQPPEGEDEKWNVVRQQNGVVRTNCMDCLDRTNVVQSLYGRSILFDQLQHFNSSTSTTSSKPIGKKNRKAGISLPTAFLSAFQKSKGLTLPWDSGEVSHRALWADNADAISRLYAGTAALKRDFTRTGKRTKLGALDDGVNSLQRYYLNNFLDADRQEGYDLLVGYQEFSNLDGDLDNGEDLSSSASSSSSEDLSMSLQEAARQMFLGSNFLKGRHDDDERHYQRIKDYKLSGGGGSSAQTHDNNGQQRPRPLDLRWLPGDLQDQMKSRAKAVGQLEQEEEDKKSLNAEFSSSEALAAIDRRAASDDPWWVIRDDNTDNDDEDEEEEDIGDSDIVRVDPFTKKINAGWVLSALLVATRAPVPMASLVVALLGAMYIPLLPPEEKEEDVGWPKYLIAACVGYLGGSTFHGGKMQRKLDRIRESDERRIHKQYTRLRDALTLQEQMKTQEFRDGIRSLRQQIEAQERLQQQNAELRDTRGC